MIDTDPGKRNKLVGYRTKKSMLNQKNWELGHKFSAQYMYKIFIVLLPFGIPFLIIDIMSFFGTLTDTWFVSSLAAQTALLLIGFAFVFYFTEKQLTISMENEKSDVNN